MRYKTLSLVLIVSTLVALAGCAAPPPVKTIKIGGAFDLTSSMSGLDLPAANGAQLAVKEINAAGGVLGQPLELVVHDATVDKVKTAQVAQQLVNQDKVIAAIGFDDGDSVLVAGPVFQNAGIPFITPGATAPTIPQQVGDLAFMTCFGDNVQAAAGAEFGYKTFGPTAYLLWDADTTYTVGLARYFNERFTALGGTVVLADSFKEDPAMDFSAQIARVKQLPVQPDFYYMSLMPVNVGPVIKQFRDAGLMGPIIGGDGYDDPSLVQIAGKASENVYFSTHALMDSTNGTDGIKKFMQAYKTEYGHDAENAFAALGYDSIYLLAAAIKSAGSTDAVAIKKALEQIKDFPGVTGSITFSANSHVPIKEVTIIELKDQKYTLAAQIVPQEVPAP